jgi:hypothetical protein
MIENRRPFSPAWLGNDDVPAPVDVRFVASLDRKRLGVRVPRKTNWTRGVFDEEASRKPLALAADAVSYGI